MTEMMLRLIKDRKIVGYELKYCGRIYYGTDMDNLKIKILLSNTRANKSYEGTSYAVPGYDSFELGIKVGDEWWFEGDKIELGDHYIGDCRHKKKNHTIIYDEGAFWFGCEPCEVICGNIKAKRTGSIHEENKNDKS